MDPHLEPTAEAAARATARARRPQPPGAAHRARRAAHAAPPPTSAASTSPRPHVDPAEWRLRVGRRRAHARDRDAGRSREMPQRSLVVVLECAGHRRAELVPATPGLQWGPGPCPRRAGRASRCAISCERAGRRPARRRGRADRRRPGPVRAPARRRTAYARSLPLRKALDPDTLLAFEMNGEPDPARARRPGAGDRARLVCDRLGQVARAGPRVGRRVRRAVPGPRLPVRDRRRPRAGDADGARCPCTR